LLEELRAKDIGLKKKHEWDHIEIINATWAYARSHILDPYWMVN
jgi:spermidine synthase